MKVNSYPIFFLSLSRSAHIVQYLQRFTKSTREKRLNFIEILFSFCSIMKITRICSRQREYIMLMTQKSVSVTKMQLQLMQRQQLLLMQMSLLYALRTRKNAHVSAYQNYNYHDFPRNKMVLYHLKIKFFARSN